jgi:hypothetical protein
MTIPKIIQKALKSAKNLKPSPNYDKIKNALTKNKIPLKKYKNSPTFFALKNAKFPLI